MSDEQVEKSPDEIEFERLNAELDALEKAEAERQAAEIEAERIRVEEEIRIVEEARLAEVARLAAIQVTIDELGDIALLVSKYIEHIGVVPLEDDSYNPAAFKAEHIHSSFGWYFARIPKPTIDDLAVFKDEVVQEVDQNKISSEAIAYLKSTDWYVTRFAETGIAIPDEVRSLRQLHRSKVV